MQGFSPLSKALTGEILGNRVSNLRTTVLLLDEELEDQHTKEDCQQESYQQIELRPPPYSGLPVRGG